MDGTAIQSCSILTVASCCVVIWAITLARSSPSRNSVGRSPNAMAVAPATAVCTKSRRVTGLEPEGDGWSAPLGFTGISGSRLRPWLASGQDNLANGLRCIGRHVRPEGRGRFGVRHALCTWRGHAPTDRYTALVSSALFAGEVI